MEISFGRTGGFAGRATNVSGTVHFEAGTAHVSSEGTNYQRALSADEATQLQSLVNAQPQQGKIPQKEAVRDGFQYDVSVKTEDGKTRSLTLSTHPDSGADLPLTLSQWVQRETQKIWQHRLDNIHK